MHHTTPYDLIVTFSVISTILFIAWKPEWCVRHGWRLLHITLPFAVVALGIGILLGAPRGGVILLIIAAAVYAAWRLTGERRRISQNVAFWRSRLVSLNPETMGPWERKAALWDAQMLEARNRAVLKG